MSQLSLIALLIIGYILNIVKSQSYDTNMANTLASYTISSYCGKKGLKAWDCKLLINNIN